MNLDFPRSATEVPGEDELRATYGVNWRFAAEVAWRVVRKNRLSEAQNHHCCHCGRITDPYAEEGRRPTTEHVIAQARGGPDTDENVVMACSRCNGLRGDRVIPEEGYVFGSEPIDVPAVVLRRHRSFDASRAERLQAQRERVSALVRDQGGSCSHCGSEADENMVIVGWTSEGTQRYEAVHHGCYKVRRDELIGCGLLPPVRTRGKGGGR